MSRFLAALRAQLAPFLDSEVHALLGAAGATVGFTGHNWSEVAAGAGYAVAMKLVGALTAAITATRTPSSSSSRTMAAGA